MIRAGCVGWILGCVLLASSACGEPEMPQPESSAGRTDATDPASEELDRLTMLGYVEAAPEVADAEKTGLTIHAAAAVAAGSTLLTDHRSCRALLMDADGQPLKSWSATWSCPNWVNARLLRTGELLVIEGKGGWALLDRDGQLVWREKIGAHHDARPLADGRFAVLLHERREVTRDGGDTAEIVDDSIAIATRDGQVVEKQSLFDVLATGPAIDLDETHAPDLLHSNSVEWMSDESLAGENPLYSLDNVLVSIRNQNRIAIVNWTTRELVWSWGPGELDKQHDATLLDDGRILLFDNGIRRGWSRVLEVDPRSGRIVWEYGNAASERFYSKGRGAVQRLANGNTLISVSDSGYAIEVTPDRRIVWEFHNPTTVRRGQSDHRAPIWVRRYPPDWLLEQHPTGSN